MVGGGDFSTCPEFSPLGWFKKDAVQYLLGQEVYLSHIIYKIQRHGYWRDDILHRNNLSKELDLETCQRRIRKVEILSKRCGLGVRGIDLAPEGSPGGINLVA